jgi:hypothetical protein
VAVSELFESSICEHSELSGGEDAATEDGGEAELFESLVDVAMGH